MAIGADMAEWDECMSTDTATQTIEMESAIAKSIGIRGTPTFLIGSLRSDGNVLVLKRITGVSTVVRWRSTLDEALAQSE